MLIIKNCFLIAKLHHLTEKFLSQANVLYIVYFLLSSQNILMYEIYAACRMRPLGMSIKGLKNVFIGRMRAYTIFEAHGNKQKIQIAKK